jgi:predicted phage terminase large subunit-like protein
VQAQDYIKKKFEDELWEAKIYVPIEGVVPKGNKHERIISLEPDIKKKFILFNSDNRAYNNQVKDYNKNAKNDDAPDSLYMAVQGVQGVKKIKFYDKGLLY